MFGNSPHKFTIWNIRFVKHCRNIAVRTVVLMYGTQHLTIVRTTVMCLLVATHVCPYLSALFSFIDVQLICNFRAEDLVLYAMRLCCAVTECVLVRRLLDRAPIVRGWKE